jgi:hypothetical protein
MTLNAQVSGFDWSSSPEAHRCTWGQSRAFFPLQVHGAAIRFAAATTAAERQVIGACEVDQQAHLAQLQRNAARRPHGSCVTNERNQDENQKL